MIANKKKIYKGIGRKASDWIPSKHAESYDAADDDDVNKFMLKYVFCMVMTFIHFYYAVLSLFICLYLHLFIYFTFIY